MTSQRSGSRSKASEVGAGPIQAHPENPSANYTPNYEEIRLRAYEIYLERGSLSGNELDDWLQAEREDQRVARRKSASRPPQERESTAREEH